MKRIPVRSWMFFYILLITFSATCGWRVVGDI